MYTFHNCSNEEELKELLNRLRFLHQELVQVVSCPISTEVIDMTLKTVNPYYLVITKEIKKILPPERPKKTI